MFSLNINGRLIEFDRPAVMGIINVTPDSFHSASRAQTAREVAGKALRMVADGAGILDIGACSTRPGSSAPDAAEEWERLDRALRAVRDAVGPEVPVSVDTYRADVARRAVESGRADIINDIGGCTLDPEMEATVAALRVPYVLMHMRGTPATMQHLCDYADVTAGVISELAPTLDRLTLAGVTDIIVDPGFGFAKTLEQNYSLLAGLPALAEALQRPVLAGVSRKSMATRLLGITAEEALPATSALHMAALERGAAILRAHDVAEAVQTVKIHRQLAASQS